MRRAFRSVSRAIPMTSRSHETYVEHAALIERAIARVCGRHQIFGAEAEEFAGVVRLHLLETAVLQRFEGRSSLTSFLLVVISRLCQDWRNTRLGKWRPSAEARRLGDVAVRLETLTVRDGFTLDQAGESLRSQGIAISRAQLDALARRFPIRHRRSFVPADELDRMAGDRRADETLAESESLEAAGRANAVVAAAVQELAAEDRLILRMRFEDGWSVSDIARVMRVEAKPLYRRFDRLLAGLRVKLEAAGLSSDEAAAAWSNRGFDLLAEGRRDATADRPTTTRPAVLTGADRE